MKLPENKFYALLVRPVVIITTTSKDGKVNAAPFSFTTPLSFSPPLFSFATMPTHDTWQNLLETKEFVANIAGKNLGRVMHILEEDFPRGVNEIEKANLHEEKSLYVKPPRIKEALGWIECKMEKYVETGDHILVVGKVLCAEVKEEFWKEVIDTKEVLFHITGEYFAQDARLCKYRRR